MGPVTVRTHKENGCRNNKFRKRDTLTCKPASGFIGRAELDDKQMEFFESWVKEAFAHELEFRILKPLRQAPLRVQVQSQ